MTEITDAPRSYWFVGASYGRTEDQTPRFLSEGIWENGYDDKHLDLVRSMQPGDRIAIKSSFTRKHNLPFDNRGNTVSVMAIKAIGTVTENLNDGKRGSSKSHSVNGISTPIAERSGGSCPVLGRRRADRLHV